MTTNRASKSPGPSSGKNFSIDYILSMPTAQQRQHQLINESMAYMNPLDPNQFAAANYIALFMLLQQQQQQQQQQLLQQQQQQNQQPQQHHQQQQHQRQPQQHQKQHQHQKQQQQQHQQRQPQLQQQPQPQQHSHTSPDQTALASLSNFVNESLAQAQGASESKKKSSSGTNKKSYETSTTNNISATTKGATIARSKSTNSNSSSSSTPTPATISSSATPANATLPAWVYCTRYSDRPSSGPRTRRNKTRSKPREKVQAIADEKRPRTAFTSEQLEKLKIEFQTNPYLDDKRRKDLADGLNLNENQIKIWFQNKRAKNKKQSNQPNPLRGLLVAGGLYNHSTATSECSESYKNEDDQIPKRTAEDNDDGGVEHFNDDDDDDVRIDDDDDQLDVEDDSYEARRDSPDDSFINRKRIKLQP